MKSILGIARADFQERSRRFSFMAMIALALFAAFWFVPRNDGKLQIMAIEPELIMQAGNSSWIPVSSAWGLGFFLPLIGFFYLRGMIGFDERSGVSQLIMSSPVGRLWYLAGKFAAGTLSLYCFAAVVLAGSFVMMLWHFPGQLLTPAEFLTPFTFLLFTLPFCVVMVIFFECTYFLRGALGSFIYVVMFFTFLILGVTIIENGGTGQEWFIRAFDLSGTIVISQNIETVMQEQIGQPLVQIMFLSSGVTSTYGRQLVFHGLPITLADVRGYSGMAGAGLVLMLLSAPVYRLTQGLAGAKLLKVTKKGSKNNAVVSVESSPTSPAVKVTYRPAMMSGRRIMSGILAECRLLLAGKPLMWWMVGLGGMIACVFVEINIVQVYLQPLLMLWFVNIYSAMGSREYRHDFLKNIAVLPNGRMKQIIFCWLSGIILTAVLAAAVMLRQWAAGQTGAAFAGLAGVIFLPSLALFLGEYTKTSRAFEMIFIIISYLIMNDMQAVMYMGKTSAQGVAAQGTVYLLIGLFCGAAAVMKRTLSRSQ